MHRGTDENPDLGGRIEIEFKIRPDGKVGRSKVSKNELEPSDTAVGACIAKAFKQWTFGKTFGATPMTATASASETSVARVNVGAPRCAEGR